ncbi:hypothetical protein [Tuwongella immobilis]|uniref:DUF4034 domain-containing protein n=1 Tax=Tuwongella immobilis TaxID=692036 RepID=A0A6C2YML9_9BACT|nr:hypothetical protein [Tuwongella immobilis]VIP02840.1 Uncharacterized protein OS=Lentisphaera araneosa HTCC2155 GN=LNTAR_23969 PE=4 SV=1 [Tuwongella immobilis]VTS02608.1 Uncharacterized protein OS=Lentisphaera araneosa HTCC2155 GN=LNTAR_23969 PE=4 SV=1 [Tuwongella immobilis]
MRIAARVRGRWLLMAVMGLGGLLSVQAADSDSAPQSAATKSKSDDPASEDKPADAGKVEPATPKSVAPLTLKQLFETGKYSDTKQYKSLRAAMERRFVEAHQIDMDLAFGDDKDAISKWFDAHPDIRGDLYTAIEEPHDRVTGVLELFLALWKNDPKLVEKHHQLAIATAVTWDNPQNVYDYTGHAVRTGSTMPGETELVDAVGNFRYLIENEKAIAPHWKHLPWEFLVFVVDHKTPIAERSWARTYASRTNPLPTRWYGDVPYDYTLLNAEIAKDSKTAKLLGQDYTLANIKSYGGVCAHQADFTARVGKSMGVPGYYCSGKTDTGVGHAWWMYVHLTSASADRIQFRLESIGRYREMQFYTGDVRNPQTGQKVLDRDLERMLTVLGNNKTACRHTRLLMRAYEPMAKELNWKTSDRVKFLDQVLRINPHCDEAWSEFAGLVVGNQLTEANKLVVRDHINTLLTKYVAYPDFVGRSLKDLADVFPAKEAVTVYTKAATQFAKAARPDLLCEVQLRVTDLLVEQKKHDLAFKGLVTAVYRFPTEGRYLPRMTQKLQEIAPQSKSGVDQLAKLYLDLVPKLVAHYRNDPLVKVDDNLVQEALDFFQANQLTKQAEQFRQRVGKP